MKKIIAYLLIATLVLSLIGCADLKDENDPNSTEGEQIKDKDDEGSKIEPGEDESSEEPAENEEPEKLEDSKDEAEDDQDSTEDDGKSDANSQGPKAEGSTAKLYFSDENAEYLNAEEREFDDLTAEALLNALIDGPQDDVNRKTIPDDTELIDVKVEDGIAYANFTKELVDNHWGGSTGETHTIYSIVNTLALDPTLDIDSVQIIIDGETVETLAGHQDITGPIEPNLELSRHK